MIPASELHAPSCHRVETIDNGRVEGRDQRWVDEVQQVGDRWAQAFDANCINALYGGHHVFRAVAVITSVKKVCEGKLITRVLVDVRNPQLGFPEESVVRSLENLALLCHGTNDRLQRGASVGVAKCSASDVLHHLRNASANGAEVLDPLIPQEPGVVGAARVCLPAVYESFQRVMHLS